MGNENCYTFDMREMKFSIQIQATKGTVWNILWSDVSFRDWANIIDAGMYMDGRLEEGNQVQFISAANGYGVTSLVEKLRPEEFVAFRQMNDTQEAGKKDREKQWTGSRETYTLLESEGMTTLTLTSDIPLELEEMMAERLPKALERIKVLSENTQD